MKEYYEKPELEIVELMAEDIICSSTDDETPTMLFGLDDEL